MQLVACPDCHTQYDVSDVAAKSFPCRCGRTLENAPPRAVDADVRRCGACGALVGSEATGCAFCGSAIAVARGDLNLICPECFARCASDARFCTACGVPFQPQRVQPEGYELPCPLCDVLMPPSQVGGIGLNECPGCHGLWVPDDHFDQLVARALEARRRDPTGTAPKPRASGSNPAAQRVQYRKCPECDGFMQRRNFRRSSGVIVDVCHAHGTWLDADELEQIAGFILDGGGDAPRRSLPPEAPRLDPRAAEALARLRTERAYARPAERGGGDVVESLVGFFSRILTP